MPTKEAPSKEEILQAIVTIYSNDQDFLETINKITFGLISGKKNNKKPYDKANNPR